MKNKKLFSSYRWTMIPAVEVIGHHTPTAKEREANKRYCEELMKHFHIKPLKQG